MRLCRVTILRYRFSLSRHYHHQDSEPCFHEPKYFSLEFEWTIICSLIDIFRSTLLLLSYRPFFMTGRLPTTRIHLICQYEAEPCSLSQILVWLMISIFLFKFVH